jgi:hypothetical protein
MRVVIVVAAGSDDSIRIYLRKKTMRVRIQNLRIALVLLALRFLHSALLLAASILFCLTQSALPQTPRTVTLTIGANASGGVNWAFPITVQIPIIGGLTYSQWYSAFGYLEIGSPLFSQEVDSDATFYHPTTVNGFPVPQNCSCYCPYLSDSTSSDSSYVAIEQVSNGPPLVWISACAKGQCTTGGSIDYWYWQIRYFSGNPAQNLPAMLQIGNIPDDGVFDEISTFSDFTVNGLPSTNTPPATNVPPTLGQIPNQVVKELTTLDLTATASDPDVPPETLTFSLVTKPSGMTIIPATGEILWRPSQPQSPSTNEVVVQATVSGDPPLSATTNFTVVVKEVNVAPVLQNISDQNVDELTELTVTNTATESNIHSNVGYELINAPEGASIDTKGVITWTPTQEQSHSSYVLTTVATNFNPYDVENPSLSATNSFTVEVNEVNIAPVLPTIPTQIVVEGAQLTVTNTATEANKNSTVSYQLAKAPAGVEIDTNGIITWKPLPAQSPSTNVITTLASNFNPYDPASPSLSATNSFTVIVQSPNVTPVLPVIPDQAVDELTQLVVPNAAIESTPNSTVDYLLVDPPAGASISSKGIITWTPSQIQSPSTNVITTIATASDPYDSIHPKLSATNSFTVDVMEVNVAPILPVIPNQTLNVSAQFTLANTAIEPNIHSTTLGYSLVNAPAGAAIDNNGIITWTPSVAQGSALYTITTVVSNNDPYDAVNPSVSQTNSFGVLVINLATQNVYTWTNTQGGDWSVAANWSPNGVPGEFDGAQLTLAGGFTVTIGAATLVESLVLGGAPGISYATLAGSGPLTVVSPFTWSGGTIQTVVACNGGALSGSCYLVGGQVINTGEMTWSDATISGGMGSVFSNAPRSVINLTASSPSSITEITYGGTATFYNAGQFNVAAGTNQLSMADTFLNTGNLSISSGLLDLQNGGTNDGTIIVATNATLQIASENGASTFACTPGSSLTNFGNLLLSGGELSLDGAASIPGTTTLAGGTLTNNAPLVTGQLNWSGGTIGGAVECNGGSVSGAELFLDGGQLVNTGTLTWTNGTIYDGAGSLISNAPGATINLTANGPVTYDIYNGTAIFYNAGQINATNSPSIGDAFINTGTVSIGSGTLSLQNGGTNDSTIAVMTNATLQFSANGIASFTCTSNSDLNGSGNLSFSGGTVNLAGVVSISGSNIFGGSESPVINVTGYYPITTPLVISSGTVNLGGAGALMPSTLTMTGGTLTNSAPLITGQLIWSGGTIGGAVQCQGGTLNGAELFLDGGQLINTGTLTWTNATIYDGNGSLISNAPGATINFTGNGQNNGQATAVAFAGPATLYNAGLMAVSAETNQVDVGDALINTGTVTIYAGTLNLQDGGTNDSTIAVMTNATLEFSDGRFTCNSGSDVTNQGNLVISGGTVNLAGTVSVAGTNIFGPSEPTVNVTGYYPIVTPLVISDATVNLNGTGALTPPTLTMSGGTLTNDAPIMTDELDWSGGAIEGVVQCNGGSVSGEEVYLEAGQLINTGTLAWDVYVLVDGDYSTISNAPGAIINMTADPVYGTLGGTDAAFGNATFYNVGQLNVSAGNNQIAIAETFFNTGAVSVHSGTLDVQSDGTNYSTMAVTEAHATLELSDTSTNPFTCTSGSSINDAGNLVVSGTYVNLAGTVSVAGSNIFGGEVINMNVTGYYPITTPLVISSGTINLNGTGALTPSVFMMSGGTLTNEFPIMAGELEWSGGWMEGVVQCQGGSLSGEEDVLYGGQLINTGTLAWNVNVLVDGAGSVISNAPGATINATANVKYNATPGTDAAFVGADGIQEPATFYNAGNLNISAAPYQFSIDDTLINTGTVSVSSGTLCLANGGTNSSTINVAAKAALQLALYPLYVGPEQLICTYPVLNFTSSSTLTDAGNLVIGGNIGPSGPFTFFGCGTYMINLGGTLNVAGSNVFGAGESYVSTVNVTGNYATTNSLMLSAPVVLNFNGTAPLTPSSMTMSGGTLSNNTPLAIKGPLNWSGGAIDGPVQCNGGTLSNFCDLQGGQLINTGTLAWNSASLNDGAGSVISNAAGATINLSVGTYAVTFPQYGGTSAFDNAGQLNFSAGPNTGTVGDTFNNSGTLSVNSGTLALSALYRQTAGLTLLNGGSVNNSLPLLIQGGTLGGSGTISGSVTNNGTVSPGKPFGTMTIDGNYVQTGLGTLNIELGGTVPGTSFDLLTVANSATLAGTLNVGFANGYVPASTNLSFTFLNANPLTGAFGNFSYPSYEVGLQLSYATDSAGIQVTNLGPVIGPLRLTAPEYSGGQFTMQIGATSEPYYVIEASTDLMHWDVLMTNTSPATPYQFTDYLSSIFGTRFYRVQLPPSAK